MKSTIKGQKSYMGSYSWYFWVPEEASGMGMIPSSGRDLWLTGPNSGLALKYM